MVTIFIFDANHRFYDHVLTVKATCKRTTFSLNLFQALGQWGRSKKWAGDRRDQFFLYQTPLVASPLFQSSTLTESLEQAWNRLLFSVFSGLGPPENLTLLNVTQRSHNTSTAMVTWLPPHNLTDGYIQEYDLLWTKMPIMSKQTSEPHSDSATLPSVSFFSLLNYLTLLVCRSLSAYHLSGIFGGFFWTNGTALFFH